MNYLAHAYLSFDKPDILRGNLMSDFVKGRLKYDYEKNIQNGITLHRAIDGFTDIHPATSDAKSFFRPAYRLYSGAFVDVVYDHFLACDHQQFLKYGGLNYYSQKVYVTIEEKLEQMPLGFQKIFPHMKLHNWLLNYGQIEGIRQSFRGLAFRAAYLNESETAFELFLENYDALKKCYIAFFPTVTKFAGEFLSNLIAD
ncbi:MAG: ACP phosphodiesterase [Ginsengibacter sp.]